MGIIGFASVMVSLLFAANRVVLFEDFTNSGCGPCWTIEPQVNAFVNSNIGSGNLAVIRVHVNWPSPSDPIYNANPTEQNVRKAQYGVSSVPFLIFDGVLISNAALLQNHFNLRRNVPSVIDILVARNGDDVSGSISIRLIAEEEPPWQENTVMKLWPILVEDNVPGVGYWAGSVFEQAFRDNLLGPFGETVTFSPPYPDTIFVDAEYTISPSWDANELYLATFLQCTYQQSDREVPNANWGKFLDIPTGIAEGFPTNPAHPVLLVSPNPSSGTFQAVSMIPDGTSGTVQVYDLSGRLAASAPANGVHGFSVDVPGVYLVRLTTDRGDGVVRRLVVLR